MRAGARPACGLCVSPPQKSPSAGAGWRALELSVRLASTACAVCQLGAGVAQRSVGPLAQPRRAVEDARAPQARVVN